MIINRWVLLLVLVPSVLCAANANIFTRDGFTLRGDLTKIFGDSIQVDFSGAEGQKNHKSFARSEISKIILSSGEQVGIDIAEWPVQDVSADTGASDPVVRDTAGLNADTASYTVAVVDLDARGVNAQNAASLSDRFREQLLSTGRFRVMERGQMNLILQEQEFQQSDACRDDQCLVEMGQLIAVQKIISGSVGKVGGMYSVSVRMLDVRTGAIDMTFSEDCDCPIEELLTQTMSRLARRLAGLGVEDRKRPVSIVRGDAALFIKADQPGCRVYVDGILMDGVTPLNLENLQAGRHALRITKGNLVAKTELVLEANKVARIDVKLAVQPTILKVLSVPSEADVWVNRPMDPSRKPDHRTPSIIGNTVGDSIRISIFKAGYCDTSLSMALLKNEENSMTVALREATAEVLLGQLKQLRQRKQRPPGLFFSASGLAVAAGGGVLLALSRIDYSSADAAKEEYDGSIFKPRDRFDEYSKKNNAGNMKTVLGGALLGAGGAMLALGLVVYF